MAPSQPALALFPASNFTTWVLAILVFEALSRSPLKGVLLSRIVSFQFLSHMYLLTRCASELLVQGLAGRLEVRIVSILDRRSRLATRLRITKGGEDGNLNLALPKPDL